MKLQFIVQSEPGVSRSERRKIRSHVMRGKNAGRPRPTTKKPVGLGHLRRTITSWGNGPIAGNSRPNPLLWSDLSLTVFPQQLDIESTKLMHRWFFDISDALFPPRFCTKFDILKSIWADCIQSDAAYFHSTLAICASYVGIYERKPRVSTTALHHISQAYSHVNRTISGPQPTTDNAIASVVSLVIYQMIHHEYPTGLTHLNGLYRMIELRGGIGKLLQENRGLALKPLRLDLELTLRTGLPSMFQGSAVFTSNFLDDAEGEGSRRQHFTVSGKASAALLEVTSFSQLLNGLAEDGNQKLDGIQYTEMVLSLLSRLIACSSYATLSCNNKDRYGSLVYLALLAFMTTLLPEYGQDCTSYPLLSDRLEGAIKESHLAAVEIQDPESSLLLWTLFIYRASTPTEKTCQWLSPLMLETCQRLGLYDWSAVGKELYQLPWIYCLHDDGAQRMWEQARTGTFG
ncbi:hypothetical protein B0I35DRAFT_276468 [Stachybotrys elegans]|uniref:Transcription factor domain-containing protein n=1 Tax=Stachybotrys elegans TaxID=80388 RepID=A0A8K0SJ23_9HYPO|nr:hypothetical protein B0I35DRAFT_276468 [Stachybotrys elegans]